MTREGLCANLIAAAGGDPKRALAGVEAELAKQPKVEGAGAGQVYMSPEIARLFDHAEQLAVKADDAFVTVERLLLALTLEKGTGAARALERGGRHAAGAERGDRCACARAARRTRRLGRGRLRCAEEVRARPHRRGARGQARPGDRPRRGDPAHDPGPLPPHQEQPGADRRARRRQDRDRRGPGAAHRQRRRAGEPQEQAPAGARPRLAGRRREVSRRVRGAAQGGARRGHRRGRRDRPVHRRAAQPGRRRPGRGLDGRVQHAQARARARRAALRRRHHARRVPQAHREGRGAGPTLPAGVRQRALGRGHDLDPARHQGEVRGPSRRAHHRWRDRRGGDPVAPLHHRPLPAGQGDRPDRRGGSAAAHAGRFQARRSSTSSTAASSSSRSSARRCRRRPTRPRRSGCSKLEQELSDLEQQAAELTARWQAEKEKLASAQKLKEELDRARFELEQAQRRGDWAKAGELAYGRIPELEKQLAAAEAQGSRQMLEEEVTAEHIA